MRISSRFFQTLSINSILDQQVRLSKTQNQLATGKRIMTPADDPVGTSQLMQLRQTENTVEQYQANSDAAINRLSTEEGVLAGVTNLLQRVREQAIQAANASQTNETRSFIAAETRQRLEELVGLANTKDGNGEYLFAGSKGFTEPFVPNAAGGYDYFGDDSQRFLQISAGRQVADGNSGSEVFGLIRNGNGSFVTSTSTSATLEATLDPPSTASASATVNPQYADAVEGYRIVFDNSVPPGVYELFDSSNVSLGTTPYADPLNISINISGDAAAAITLSGVPENGDEFVLHTGGNAGTGMVTSTSVQGRFEPALVNGVNGYTLHFIQADPGDPITYEVLTSGDLNPLAPPVTGTYTSGEPIPFRGALVTLNGTPADGDTFSIRSSENQNIFQTLQNFITALETPVTSPAEMAELNNDINRFLTDIDQGMDNILTVRAGVGARLNAIDAQRYINDDQLFQTTKIISSIEDLDYAEAISRLNLQMAGLQAAQQTYLKVQDLSLFNFLR